MAMSVSMSVSVVVMVEVGAWVWEGGIEEWVRGWVRSQVVTAEAVEEEELAALVDDKTDGGTHQGGAR